MNFIRVLQRFFRKAEHLFLPALENKSEISTLVGTNMTGSNAFFVKNELAKDLFPEPATAENLFNPAHYYMWFPSGHAPKYYIG